MSKHLINTAILAGLLTATLPAHARVFWRSGIKEDPVAASQLGWDRAYKAKMKVNGAPAQVEILQSDRDLVSTRKQLQRLYEGIGANVAFFTGRESGWGLVTHNEQVIRILLFQLDDRPFPAVFRMRQSRSAFKKTKNGQPLERVTNLPAYPGSRFTHSSVDETTGMALEVARAGTSPEDIRSFYESSLPQSGWKPALPSGGAGNPLGTILFMKGRTVCMISVKPSSKSPDNIITMAVKKSGEGLKE